jgi:putative transposase
MLAVDFFTVETISLQRLYVPLSSSWATAAFTSPAAPPTPLASGSRNRPASSPGHSRGQPSRFRFLIRDRDSKFTRNFDAVFASEGIEIVKTPVSAPKANAERFVGAVRRECLDWLLILSRRHLEHVLDEFVDSYNVHRPHRSLGLTTPAAIGCERPAAFPLLSRAEAARPASAGSSTSTATPPEPTLRTPQAVNAALPLARAASRLRTRFTLSS